MLQPANRDADERDYCDQGCSPKKKWGNLQLHRIFCCTEIILHCVSVSNQLQQWTNFCTNFSPKKRGRDNKRLLCRPVEASSVSVVWTLKPTDSRMYTSIWVSYCHRSLDDPVVLHQFLTDESKPTISAAGRIAAKLYSQKPSHLMNRISLLGLCINIVIKFKFL